MTRAKVHNAASHRQNEAAARSDRVASEQAANDLRWLMNDHRGRRIVWRMLTDARVFQTTFTPDPYQTAFNEGWRNVGCSLLTDVNACCPEKYMVMAQEAMSQEKDGQSVGD